VSKQSTIDILLKMNTDTSSAMQDLSKFVTGASSQFETLARNTNASLGTISKTFGDNINLMTQALERLAQVMDKSAKPAKAPAQAQELYGQSVMKKIQSNQTDPLKRAIGSIDMAMGVGKNYEFVTQQFKNLAAMASSMAAQVKGTGTMSSKENAAASMRALTKIDRAIINTFTSDNEYSDLKRMLGTLGGDTGNKNSWQRMATDKFRTQLEGFTSLMAKTYEGLDVVPKGLKDQIARALEGVKPNNTMLAKNLQALGKEMVENLHGYTSTWLKDESGQMKRFTGKAATGAMRKEMFYDESNKLIRGYAAVLSEGSESTIKQWQKSFPGIEDIKLPEDFFSKSAKEQRSILASSIRDIQKLQNQLNKEVRTKMNNQFRSLGTNALKGQMTSVDANAPITVPYDDPEVKKATGLAARLFSGITSKFHGISRNIEKSQSRFGDELMKGVDAVGYRLITISYMLSNYTRMMNDRIKATVAQAASRMESIGKVQPIVSGQPRASSTAEVAHYSEELYKLSGKYGVAYEELASVLYDAASAFPEVADKMKIVTTSAKMAAVGFGGAAKNMEGMVAVAKTYYGNLAGSKNEDAFEAAMIRIGNLSAAAAQVGTLELSELGDAMQTMAPTAKNLGISIEELYASIAAAAGVVGNTSEAANKLKQFFVSILSPNAKMSEFYQKKGYANGKDFIDKSGGVAEAVKALEVYVDEVLGTQGSFKGLTGRSQAQEAIFGLENAMELFKNFTTTNTFLGELNVQLDAATEGYARNAVQLNAANERLKQTTSQIGEAFIPFQTALVDMKNRFLKVIVSSGEFGATMLSSVAIIGTVVAGLFGLVGALSLASRAISTISLDMARGRAMKLAANSPLAKNAGELVLKEVAYDGKVVVSAGTEAMPNIGSATAIGAGGSMALLGSILVGILALGAIIAIVTVIKKNAEKAARERIAVAVDTTINPRTSAVAAELQAKIDAYEKASEDRAAALRADLDSFASQREADVAQITLFINALSGGKDSVRNFEALAKGLRGEYGKNVGDILKAALPQNAKGALTKPIGEDREVHQRGMTYTLPESFTLSGEIAKAVEEKLNEIKSQYSDLAVSARGAMPLAADKAATFRDDEATRLKEDLKSEAASIVADMVADALDVVDPSNWVEKYNKAVVEVGNNARKKALGEGKRTTELDKAVNGATEAFADFFNEYAGRYESTLNDAGIKKPGDKVLAEPNLQKEWDDELRAYKEIAAKSKLYAKELAAAGIATTTASDRTAKLEEMIKNFVKTGVKGTLDLAEAVKELNGLRIDVKLEEYDKARAASQKTISTAFGVLGKPPVDPSKFNKADEYNKFQAIDSDDRRRATDEILSVLPSLQGTEFTSTATKLKGSVSGEDAARVNKALLDMLPSLTGDRFASAFGMVKFETPSTGINTGTLGIAAGSIDAMQKLLSMPMSRSEILYSAGEFSVRGGTLGKGMDQMSPLSMFVSGMSGKIDAEMFKTLRPLLEGGLLSPGDKAVFESLKKTFDVFEEAAKSAKDAFGEEKAMVLGEHASAARQLAQKAAQLHKDLSNLPELHNNKDAIESTNGLIDALYYRQKYENFLSSMDGIQFQKWLESGGAFKAGDEIGDGVSDGLGRVLEYLFAKKPESGGEAGKSSTKFWRDMVKLGESLVGIPKMIKTANDNVQAWAKSTKDYKFDKKLGAYTAVPDGKISMETVGKGIGDLFMSGLSLIGDGLKGIGSFLFEKKARSDTNGDGEVGAGDKATTGLGGITGEVINFFMFILSKSKSFQTLMNGMNVILGRMLAVIEPTLDQALVPLLGIFGILGQTLGQIMLPIFQALLPAVEALLYMFIEIYNFVLPVMEFLLDTIVMLGISIENIVYGLLQFWTKQVTFWDDSDDNRYDGKGGKNAFTQFGTTELQAINIEQVEATGMSVLQEVQQNETGANSSTEAVRAPDMYFNFYIGSDAITDVQGGRIVSVDYILDQLQERLNASNAMSG